MDDDEKCTCQAPAWCGATKADVIRQSMTRGMLLNREQAEADWDRAQSIRRERGMVLESSDLGGA